MQWPLINASPERQQRQRLERLISAAQKWSYKPIFACVKGRCHHVAVVEVESFTSGRRRYTFSRNNLCPSSATNSILLISLRTVLSCLALCGPIECYTAVHYCAVQQRELCLNRLQLSVSASLIGIALHLDCPNAWNEHTPATVVQRRALLATQHPLASSWSWLVRALCCSSIATLGGARLLRAMTP